MKPETRKQEAVPFYVYADRSSMNNHFIPSGWLGDYGDLKYDGASKEDPYLGDTCIKIVYSGKASNGARWAGIYWQYPANNWGTVDKGYDLSKATKLTFWARGAKGGERIEEFKMGGIMGEFSDSDAAGDRSGHPEQRVDPVQHRSKGQGYVLYHRRILFRDQRRRESRRRDILS